MGVEKLERLARVGHDVYPHYTWMQHWTSKKDTLNVLLHDLNEQVLLFKQREIVPYKNDERIKLVDMLPSTRLASTAESSLNCIYSMAEIAARFGHICSKNRGPNISPSFKRFLHGVESGHFDRYELKQKLGDIEWYYKAREVRTELAHYSSIFVGMEDEEPILVIYALRQKDSDQKYVRGRTTLRVNQLQKWISESVKMIDVYADFLAEQYVIPNLLKLPRETIQVPSVDESGMLKILPDGRMAEWKKYTKNEYVEYCGYQMG